MSEMVVKILHDCLVSEFYSFTVYEKLAKKAHDEITERLLLHYADEEKDHFDWLCAYYHQLTNNCADPFTLPQITVFDFYTSLLECISHKITDIDKYKTLSAKMQAADLRSLFLEILQSKVRQGFGLLVLITPEDIPLNATL